MSAPLICLFQNMVQLYSNTKLQVPFNMQQETEKWQLALAWGGGSSRGRRRGSSFGFLLLVGYKFLWQIQHKAGDFDL